MTLYTVKLNKFEKVKTTSFHEAVALAKKALVEKIAPVDKYIAHTSEKMYIHKDTATYRIFASVYEGKGRVRTFSNSIRIEHIFDGDYNWTLDRELSEMVREVKNNDRTN